MKQRKLLSMLVLLSMLLCSAALLSSCAMEPGDSEMSKGDGGYSPSLAPESYSRSKSEIMAYEDGKDGEYTPAEEPYLPPDGEGTTDDGETGEKPEDPVEEPEKPDVLSDVEIRDLVRAGLITAGAWDDNRYYSMWQDLFDKGQTAEENGKFVSYADNSWHMYSRERVKVTVTKDEVPVAGAKVVLQNGEGIPVFKAVTDVKGNAYLFSDTESGKVLVTSDGVETVTADFTDENRELAVALTSAAEKKNLIQLMFVVDVTGSMGDEINYLKAELGDVIARVAQNDSETKISLSFLFYRDNDDDVNFCYVDFRDVTDPDDYAVQQAELAKQYADGGGDYPEALDEALELAVSKQWSENATKMIFLVLDAPAHEKEKNKVTYSNAVLTAAEKGIRVCPVLASGADTLTEYITRSAAILTGGTFVYITDDSGIGGGHLDPNLPNVVIERLNLLMVRLIKGYHTGDFGEPIPWNYRQ